MPIYEYECSKCGVVEVSQRITDSPLRRCPNCKGKVSKLISSTSFQLKGSGWYVTDYASKGDGNADSKGEKTEASASSETSPKSDSKVTTEKKPSSSAKADATAA